MNQISVCSIDTLVELTGIQQYSDKIEGQSSTGLASVHLGQNDESLLRIVANRVEVEAHREPKIVLSVVISGIRILIGKRQGSDSVRGLVRWIFHPAEKR